MNNNQEERERKRKLSAWLTFKRRTSQITANFQIDGSKIISAVDQEIETATKQVQSLDEIDDSDFSTLQYASQLPGALIEARAYLRWSQKELGAEVGLKKEHISRYENSHYCDIGLSKALRIAEVLQTALAERKAFLNKYK